MKKVVTIDTIIASLAGAVGYGLGYTIPSRLGFHPIICFVICTVLGTIMDTLAEKIVFSSLVQASRKRRHLTFVCIVLIFIAFYFYMAKFYAYSLLNDVTSQMAFVVVIPMVFFLISLAVNAHKRKKLLEKYGTGESGIKIDQDFEKIWENYFGENKELTEYNGNDPMVKTTGGRYVGKADKYCVRFLGIPYAKAPTGSMRWKNPVPVDASDRIYEAYYFGDSEIQPVSDHNILNRFNQSEDCLNLNVLTAKLEPDAKKPVVVYFHGGDGRYGGCASPQNHLMNIAKSIPEAVFVSFNYRIGVFGVISFDSSVYKDADKYKYSASLTLLDQIEALKWVKNNISAFGGDPENVTVIGDNTGGSCICQLAVIKEAQGLFKRAFIMCASSVDSPTNEETVQSVGKTLCEEFNATSIADLEAVTSEQLRDFTNRHYPEFELPPSGCSLVPENVSSVYKSGVASDIEFIYGLAEDDASGWIAMIKGDVKINDFVELGYRNIKKYVLKRFPNEYDSLLDSYKASGLSEQDAKFSFVTDFLYKTGPLHDCISLSEGGAKIRCFYWNVKGDIENLKASSLSLITTLLGNKDIAEQMGYINDQNITEIIQTFFRKYIKGEPLNLLNNEIKGVDKVEWDEFTKDTKRVLNITKDNFKMADDVFAENIIELEKLM